MEPRKGLDYKNCSCATKKPQKSCHQCSLRQSLWQPN